MKVWKTPIVYAKQEIAGLMVRPDSRQVLLKAVEGHPIDVYSGNDYINLYHVFERLVASDRKRYGKLKIIRRQTSASRWRIFIVRDESEVPAVDLDAGYDPKRGRYKRHAEELAAGETVYLPTKKEAIKVRRAWQLYVPSKERRHLRSTIQKVGLTGKHAVRVVKRARPIGGE